MARPINRKCLECASLPIQTARQRPCWTDERELCHKRRSHYLKRGDRNTARRRGYRSKQNFSRSQPFDLLLSSSASVILVIYSEQPERFKSNETLVHALGAELWVGTELKEQMVPQLCLGKRGDEVAQLPSLILKEFSDRFAQAYHQSKPFPRFAAKVHRHICFCPIVNPFQSLAVTPSTES